jgi:regulator of protease activity HflC (stomatin/prohibitin superfamily)
MTNSFLQGEGSMLFVLMALVVFALVVIAKSVQIVPQAQVRIVERLGKFHKTATAGLNIILPFLDSIRRTHDLREQITPIEPQPAITRDNVTMEVDAVIYYVIADPVRATYEIEDLKRGLEQLTLSALRNVIGSLDLDHTLTSRDTTNSQLRAALDSATQKWGVKILRVELKNLNPPEEIKLTMEKQMTAERTRRATVTEAEGQKASAILRAEGEKQARIVSAEGAKQSTILAAEGQAEARLRVAEAEAQAINVVTRAIGSAGNPAQYLIAQRYLDSLTQIASNAQKLVFLPYEAAGVMASLGSMKELFKVSGLGGASASPGSPGPTLPYVAAAASKPDVG